MKKKYKLIKDKNNELFGKYLPNGDFVDLYRIEAIEDFDDVKKGDIGGFVEDESNLLHTGNCWIYGDAIVAGCSIVSGNVKVYGSSAIYCKVNIDGDVKVYNSEITGDIYINGNIEICDCDLYSDTRCSIEMSSSTTSKLQNININGF